MRWANKQNWKKVKKWNELATYGGFSLIFLNSPTLYWRSYMNWLYCPDGSDSYENFFGWFFGGVKQISTDSLFFVLCYCTVFKNRM